ncbi:MAG: ATP/GTP-binding protein [Candidatus Bathyarchaeia archaeon]
MNVAFIVGTAGSGKSALTDALVRWFRSEGQNVISVNLDPAVLDLPYRPEVDVRDHVVADDLMRKYKLGPNAAIIMASDLVADRIGLVKEDMEEYRADLAIVDTPGQMEVFAFRESGAFIAREITKDLRLVVYLFDAPFSRNPFNFISSVLLAAAVHNRFLLPQLYTLSKLDLVGKSELERILDWSEDAALLEEAVETQISGPQRVMMREILHVLSSAEIFSTPIPTSAETNEGIIDLAGAILRVFTSGEKYEV